MRLHGGAQNGRGRRSGEVPGFIGRKLLKRGFRCVFENIHDQFQRRNVRIRKEVNSPVSQGRVDYGLIGAFHSMTLEMRLVKNFSGRRERARKVK